MKLLELVPCLVSLTFTLAHCSSESGVLGEDADGGPDVQGAGTDGGPVVTGADAGPDVKDCTTAKDSTKPGCPRTWIEARTKLCGKGACTDPTFSCEYPNAGDGTSGGCNSTAIVACRAQGSDAGATYVCGQ